MLQTEIVCVFVCASAGFEQNSTYDLIALLPKIRKKLIFPLTQRSQTLLRLHGH